MSAGPILFYCQHLLGLGHLERAARLTRALRRAGEPVVFVQGGRPVPALDLGNAEVVELPPLVAANEAASALARPDGRPPEPRDLADRRDRLLGCLRTHDPSVILLELFPFGRHALTTELGPLLLAAADDRARRGAAAPRVAVSLRDVLVSKPNQAWAELAAVAVARQWTDRVLVHGSSELIPLDRTLALADRLGERLVYTGYLGPDGGPGPRGSRARRGRDLGRRGASRRAALPRCARGVAPHVRGARTPLAPRDRSVPVGRPRATTSRRRPAGSRRAPAGPPSSWKRIARTSAPISPAPRSR